jgi:hypothetical protein
MPHKAAGEGCDDIDISPEWDLFGCQDSPPGSPNKMKGSHR